MTSRIPSTSVVMIDGSFRESYHAVDFFCTQTLPIHDYEVLWVEYFDSPDPALMERVDRYPNFRVIVLGRQEPYHSSLCFNAGISASRGELVFIPDADIAVESGFLETARADHRKNSKLVMYFYRYIEPEEQHRSEIDLDHLRTVSILTNPSNFGGCLSLRKQWLLEINGYDQHPLFGSGFHANGLDVYTRLKNLGLHVKWHPELKLYHPWHPLTLASSSAYEMQHLVIKDRAKQLTTIPFQGIDQAQDHDPDKKLLRQMEAIRVRHQGGKTLGSLWSRHPRLRPLIRHVLR
jgi:hypothetical protein